MRAGLPGGPPLPGSGVAAEDEGPSIPGFTAGMLGAMMRAFASANGANSDGPRNERNPNVKLAKMPTPGGSATLPSIKAWNQWYDVRLKSWAGAQTSGFIEAIDRYVKQHQPDEKSLDKYQKDNRLLAYELCNMVDDKLLAYLMEIDKTHGAKILRTLTRVVTRGSAERTAALHSRFAAQEPCKSKERLLRRLQLWREDLEELQAAGSAPSRETVLSSLRLLAKGVRELNNLLEITELLAPGDPKKIYQAVHKRAAEWAVLDSDPRTGGNSAPVDAAANAATVGAQPCRFFPKGTCQRGDKCRFSHAPGAKGKGKGKKGGKGGKGKGKGECVNCGTCGKVTDRPHTSVIHN